MTPFFDWANVIREWQPVRKTVIGGGGGGVVLKGEEEEVSVDWRVDTVW